MSFSAPITRFGSDAYDYLEPLWADDDQRGFPLQTLVAGLCEPFRQVEEICRALTDREPWQQAYDITRAPTWFLQFLGFYVGVPVITTRPDAAQRTQIEAETGFYRGSIKNMLAAMSATQTEPNRVSIIERDPDAWNLTVVYDPADTPDVAALEAAAWSSVPWAMGITFVDADRPLWEQGTLVFETVGSTITYEAATLADVT